MIWLIPLLFAPQDDPGPLREGTALTYEVKDADGPGEAATEQTSALRGTCEIGGESWLEVSNFLFYEKAYVRVGKQGFEFRAPEYGEHTLLLFKKGARVGDSWSSDLTDTEKVRYVLEAEETVEVPAGPQQAFRVSFVITGRQGGKSKREAEGVIWMAPRVGPVKGWISRGFDCHAGVTRSFALKRIERK